MPARMTTDTNTGIIAREGFPFILGAALTAVGIGALSLAAGLQWLSWVALLAFGATFFVTWFFRNPERFTPDGDDLVISPADGRVLAVEDVQDTPYGGGPSVKVSIFMSVMDVHVNRAPISGKVVRKQYFAGRFLVASLDKASEENERSALTLEDASGRQLTVVQIAGLIARRIVTYPREGGLLTRGNRYGLIRFGSRLELYLPPGTEIAVGPGTRTRSGETVIGKLPAVEPSDA